MPKGKCDVCGKIKELEPPRKKFLDVPDDYMTLCLECRALQNTRRSVSTQSTSHLVGQPSPVDNIMTSGDAYPTCKGRGVGNAKKR